MTSREMQMEFDLIIQQLNPEYDESIKPDSYTIFKYINQAQIEVCVTNYTGNNNTNESVEQTQKKIDDLRILVEEAEIATLPGVGQSSKENSVIAPLPNDYMFRIGEEVSITYDTVLGTDVTKRQGVTEATSDTYSRELENPYSEHRLHRGTAKPLRLFKGGLVELISDGNYDIDNYYLRYLRFPNIINLDGNDCELPEHMHTEIVNRAVVLFLGVAQGYEAAIQELDKQE